MKKIGIVLLFALLANFVSAEVVKNITNLAAGKLSTVLNATEKATVNRLTIQGMVNASDLLCMRSEMPMLTDVDLSSSKMMPPVVGSTDTGIPAYAFCKTYAGNQNLRSFSCPKNTSYIGEYAFGYCSSLTNIALDSCIYSIGQGAFAGCTALTSVYLPDCLNIIDRMAFGGCTALSGRVTIPNAVKTIVDCAFDHCTKLNELVIGTSVDSIGMEAFNCCYSLSSVRFLGSKKTKVGDGAFNELAQGSIIYVPVGSKSMIVTRGAWLSMTTLMEYRTRISSVSAARESATSLKLMANFDFLTEDEPIESHGFCLNRYGMATINDSLVVNENVPTLGNYTNIVTTFSPGVVYSVRPYVIDRYGVIYGTEMTVTAPAMPGAAGMVYGPTEVVEGESEVGYSVLPIDFATSYVWVLPKGVTGTSTANYIIVSFAKGVFSGTIKVFGRNENGDGGASTITFKANPVPKDAGKILGYSSLCQGESQVTYSVPVIEGATSYVWTLPTGASGSSTSNSIKIDYSKTAVSGKVMVAGKNNWGLGTISSLAVTVHQLPSVELRDTVVTYATALTLNPVVKYTESGVLKYKWTPSTNLSNDSILNPVATAYNNITYTLTVTTPYGCTSSKDVKISLKTMDKPVIGIVGIVNGKNRIAWNKPVSQGVASYLIYKETNVTDVYEKIGSVPYDSLSVFVDANSVPDVKSSKYKISVLDKSGLESLQSESHKTMHLSINKGQNSSWNLIWEAYEGFKPTTYNIYRGTSPTSLNFLDATSASSTQYTDLEAPSGNVYYQLEVISPNLVSPTKVSLLRSVTATYNSSRSNVAAGIVNGLDETTSAILVYPNPMKNVLNIKMEGGSTFEILNLTGQVVYKGDLKESTVVNTSNFKPGMYMVKVEVGTGYEFRKVIKVE